MTRGLTAKLMKVKLKNGWTKSDFASYLNCTENEVDSAVYKAFSKNAANDMLAQMRSNHKKAGKKKNTTASFGLQLDTATPIQLEKIEETETEILTPDSKLDLLKNQEAKFSKELCTMETYRKELVSIRKTLKSSLQNEKNDILHLRALIEEHQAKVETTINELNNINSQISTLNEQISTKRHNLETLHKEIKELEKITIFVYENDSLEFENLQQSQIPDSWQKIYDDLRANTLVEDLTLRQAKQLSKVLALAKSLQDNNLSFEVTFENEDLEYFFRELYS